MRRSFQNKIREQEFTACKDDIELPSKDYGKIELIQRFISEDVEERFHQGKKLTVDGKSVDFASASKKPEVEKFEETIKGAKTIHVDEVECFRRNNVGGKTRWYKLNHPTSGEPLERICKAQDIESRAQKFSLQALLVQMDKNLFGTFHFQASSTPPKSVEPHVDTDLLF